MIRFRLLAVALATSAAVIHAQAPVTQPPVPGAPASVTAFVNVGVLSMDTERILPNQTVLVEGGRIVALGPARQVKISTGATRIDGRGKYLMPGLADMHAHLFTAVPRADSAQAERLLFLFLANGVTTIRNMDYTSREHGALTLHFRTQAAAGELWSPRIYSSGPIRWMDAAPDSMTQLVAAYKAAGYDFVKMRGNTQGTITDSFVAAAHRAGLPFSGHVNGDSRALERALSMGYRSIEHLMGYETWAKPDSSIAWSNKRNEQTLKEVRTLSAADSVFLLRQRQWLAQEMSPAKIRALAEATARAGVWNCPTQVIYELISLEAKLQGPPAFPEFRYVSAEWRREWRFWAGGGTGEVVVSELGGRLDIRRQVIKALQDAGAGLLLGADAPMTYMVPGFSVHRELAALVRAGLTPYQALVTGTRNAAAFFGTLDETGTVAVGKRADLVLLKRNPLQDIGNTAEPAGVMVSGRWLPRTEIERRLVDIAAAVSSP